MNLFLPTSDYSISKTSGSAPKTRISTYKLSNEFERKRECGCGWFIMAIK